MNGSRWLMIALCLVCSNVALAQSATPAPTPAARTEASQRFRRGVELFQEEAFREALVEFQRAYDVAPDYRLLYNIGQAKLAVRDYLGAAQSYDRFLSEGGNRIPPERRDQVEQALAALRERVGRIGIYTNVDGAEVFIDDVLIGKTPIPSAILANVGQHRVHARTSDGATDARIVDVPAGDVAEVALTLIAPKGSTVIVRERDKSWSMRRKQAVTAWAIGGGLLAGGLVTGLLALRESSDLDKMLQARVDRPRVVEDQRSKVKGIALTTDILVATGAAAAVAGTLLWMLDRTSESKPETPKSAQVHWGVGLGTLSVRSQF